MTETLERGRGRAQGFADAEMDFQLLRQMGSARYGGASIGECLALAGRIRDGVPQSWVEEFATAAANGADGHCQSGNLAYAAAVALDWLDESLA